MGTRSRQPLRREVPLALLQERSSARDAMPQSQHQESARLGVGVETLERGGYMPVSIRWMLIDDHKAAIEEMQAKHEELEHAVRALKNELAQTKPQIPVLSRELDASEAHVQRLQMELDAVKADAKAAREQASAELERQRSEISAGARALAALEAERRHLLAGLSQAKDAEQAVAHAFEHADAEASARRGQQLAQARLYAEARAQASEQRHALGDELAAARAEASELYEQLEATRGDVARLSPALLEQTSLTERLSAELGAALSANEGLRDEVEGLLASKSAGEQQCAAHAAELATLRMSFDAHAAQSAAALSKCAEERQACQRRMQQLEAAAIIARRGAKLVDRMVRHRLEVATAALHSDAWHVARPMQWTHTDAERRALLPRLLEQRWTALMADIEADERAASEGRDERGTDGQAPFLGSSDDAEGSPHPRQSPPRPWGDAFDGAGEVGEEDAAGLGALTAVDVAHLTREALGKFMEASVVLAQACV